MMSMGYSNQRGEIKVLQCTVQGCDQQKLHAVNMSGINRSMKIIKVIINVSLLLVLWLLAGCEQDDNVFVKQPPRLIPLNAPALFTQGQGLPVRVEIELQAASGLARLEVFQDDELFDARDYDDELLTTYVFEYTFAPSLPDGARINFRFELTDKEGRAAAPYTLPLRVGPAFSQTEETINGTTVTRIKGRINRSILLGSQRSYLLDSIVTVEEGSTLTIQAGTTIYMRTFNDGRDSRLVVTQGSKLIADIVFGVQQVMKDIFG